MPTSSSESRLTRLGSEGRDAVLDVAMRADLPWLVVHAAAATEFVCGAEELGCDLGAAVSADDGGGGLEPASALQPRLP